MRVLIFGGTGSLGKVLVRRLLEPNCLSASGCEVSTFSRDEAKSVTIKQLYPNEVNSYIGDIRDADSVERVVLDCRPNIIINAAALKNVPEGEKFPFEFVRTNIIGSQNLVTVAEKYSMWQDDLRVLSISTDKAPKAVNAYGMTKALQEKIHLSGKGRFAAFNCVRYGNVLQSRGSVIPFFNSLIEKGENLRVTDKNMTRFFLSLDESVDLIFRALREPGSGKIFIPKIRSAKIVDLAEIMIEHSKKNLSIDFVGIRPGEKIHEILISEEELRRVEEFGDVFVISKDDTKEPRCFFSKREYSSGDENYLLSKNTLRAFLQHNGVL